MKKRKEEIWVYLTSHLQLGKDVLHPRSGPSSTSTLSKCHLPKRKKKKKLKFTEYFNVTHLKNDGICNSLVGWRKHKGENSGFKYTFIKVILNGTGSQGHPMSCFFSYLLPTVSAFSNPLLKPVEQASVPEARAASSHPKI